VAEADAEQVAELPVGEYLRSVREARGLNLDEASRVTKIGKNYLVAIEEGQFEKLPNAAYIKGFIRLYATYLGLSGDDAVRRYEQGLPSARPQLEAKPVAERPQVQLVERAKLAGPGRWLIPVVLLVLVIVTALFFTDGEDKRERPAAKNPPPPAAVPAPAPAAVQPQRSSAQIPAGSTVPVNPAQPQPATAPQAQQPAPVPAESGQPAPGRRDGIILRLRFNQDSWLSITIDDSISQRYDLKAGDIIEWKGKRSFVLDIGDGAAAEGDINGRPLKALGEPGKPAHVELKNE
jgi:cytoskeleton protein RodZ